MKNPPNFPPVCSSRNLPCNYYISFIPFSSVEHTETPAKHSNLTASIGTMNSLFGNGTRESPIILDDDDDDTCAICLDNLTSMTKVGTISGCTHKFCFDCIDMWAATENSCPCCKARFRTIYRVVPLPPSLLEDTAATTGTGEKRSTNLKLISGRSNTGTSSTDHSIRRVSFRTVEDRRQPAFRGVSNSQPSLSTTGPVNVGRRRSIL